MARARGRGWGSENEKSSFDNETIHARAREEGHPSQKQAKSKPKAIQKQANSKPKASQNNNRGVQDNNNSRGGVQDNNHGPCTVGGPKMENPVMITTNTLADQENEALN